jgi:lactoylglutathione lyase
MAMELNKMSGADGFVLNQTMLRIKDPEKTVAFYRDVLGDDPAGPL